MYTRHNEVAERRFRKAGIFTPLGIACLFLTFTLALLFSVLMQTGGSVENNLESPPALLESDSIQSTVLEIHKT